MAKVFFCVPQHAAFVTPVTKALEILGHEVRGFDYLRGGWATRTLGLIGNTFGQATLVNPILQSLIEQKLTEAVEMWRPHLVLVVKGETLRTQLVQKIRSLGFTVVNWYPDWLESWTWVRAHAPAYSLFATCCLNLYHELKKIGVKPIYLPFASNPDIVLPNRVKKYPLTFVGQYTLRREKNFAAIRDLGLTIWGYQGWQNSTLKNIAHPSVTPQKTLDIFRQSKIVVNMLTGSDEFEPASVNNRTFEALGVGSFLLIKRHPILYRHFKPDEEFIVFDTPEELRRKAIYYLENESKRDAIARRGWLRVKKDHTYTKRVKELFNYLELV